MDDRIELIVADPNRKQGGTSIAIAASFVVHAAILFLFLQGYRPAATVEPTNTPMVRYVELMRNNPREFVEAPGPAVDRAPMNAPLSDADRRASGPNPTGDKPTKRPGDGSGLYTPPIPESRRGTTEQQPPLQTTEASSLASPAINWGTAIREAAKVASISGQDLDLSGMTGSGGEKGTFEQGPLSFETQWYDWGEYAQSMVSKIRINWYGQMPQLIRTGLKGVVTIRFTIQRDGRITDVTMLESSTAPPYDFAARKAIELSSPLNPLPKDFPNPSERVVARFFYNSKPPAE